MNAGETCLQKPNGWGVYDWARAMANNGGRALIGTFWSVEDEAAKNFFITFYRHFFKEDKTIVESIRLEKKELISDSIENFET
jgi:CHAT domain-containing protein